MKYLEPWENIEDRASYFEDELTRELSPGHVLYAINVSAVASRIDCDDVLFKLDDINKQYAVVHLTYSKEANPEFPITRIFKSLESWVEGCMLLDHEDYTG